MTKKLISGPLVVKTDAGPGRLSKEAESVLFREQMAEKGVHILLSLPNATSCTAEMDQLFEKFKPACSKSALRLAARKMQSRMEVRVAEKGDKVNESYCNNDDKNPIDQGVLDKHQGRSSICNVSFTNLDLGNLVNGWPDDPIELRPFDCHFNPERIIKTWLAVGFMPMTGNAAKNSKVRYELGEGGAPPDAAVRMSALHESYKKAGYALTDIGLNGAMLDIELPKVKVAPVFVDDEEKIKHIVENRLINKAGGLYKTGLIVANCRVVVEAAKRIAELDKRARLVVELKKGTDAVKLSYEARKAHRDWVSAGKPVDDEGSPRLNKKDSYAIVKFLLPIVDITGALKLKDYNSMKKCVAWLGGIARGMNWDEHMVAAGLEIRDQWEAEGLIDGEKISYDTPSLF